jgi:hypothetical protein
MTSYAYTMRSAIFKRIGLRRANRLLGEKRRRLE